ncbi:GNAT family N-acetyltransferase [Dactylosporangium sp. NPDC005555]|uniref:GNAT family N-acetyltransferase n=1 Tax=Dactylosporangium sp. NPDC005555 TaxID=3154889 RepID=UPI0033A6928B
MSTWQRPAPATPPCETAFDQAVADAAPTLALLTAPAPALVIAELMVASSHRRQGIAAQLLSTYIADAPAAWLVTHRDGGAPAFYQRQGWRQEAAFTSAGVPMLLYTWAPRAEQERAAEDG